MKQNMGIIDRVARVIIAIIIANLFITKLLTGIVGIIALILAAIFILTSVVSFCPLYLPFGFSTCPNKSARN